MNKRIQRIIASIVIGCTIFNTSVGVWATDKLFVNHTVKDGLSQGTVFAIFQDSDGYIWVGTADGLNRYNGYEYSKYYKGEEIEKTIINNDIRYITEDNNKNLWVGTVDGISKINLKDYSITDYTAANCSLNYDKVYGLCTSNNGKIIVSTFDGLSFYDEEKNDFTLIDYNVGEAFYALKNYGDKYVYGISNHEIFKLDTETNEVEKIITEETYRNITKGAVIDFLMEGNNIWLGTFSDGLINYNLEQGSVVYKEKIGGNQLSDDSYSINSIYKDRNGNMYLATDIGLVSYNGQLEKKIYQYNLYDKYTIANNTILSFMEDKSGLMWIGTYSGISTFRPDEGITHYGNNLNSDGQGLLGNIIHGLYEDEEGKIWAGCNGYGVTIIDRKNNIYEYITEDSESPISSSNTTTITGNKDKVFLASDKGIDIIDKKTKKIEKMPNIKVNETVFTTYVDGDELWVGTSNGISKINLNNYNAESYNFVYEKAEIEDYVTATIMKDSKGVLWFGLGVSGGLVSYNPENNEIKSYVKSGESGSISDNAILYINEDEKGNMWIGTTGGINILDRQTDKFKLISTKDGLVNNTIYSILFDDYKDIWISTNLGVERISIDDIDNISIQENIRNTEFNNNASIITSSGEFIFGGIDGLYIFEPSKTVKNNYVPKLNFDTLKVNGIEINDFDNVSFEENNNSLYIKLFTSIYEGSRNTKFYYKLDKNSKEWTSIEGNEITLSNLSAGKYQIQFKALSSNGAVSYSEDLDFEVKPPFWKGRIAKGLYILGFMMIAVYVRKKIKRMDDVITIKDNQLFIQMEEKNSLLEKVLILEKRKNNYLINMSHELRTPLNVIYSIQQLLTDLNEKDKLDKKELNRYIEMCCKNVHRLLKLINDLIDSSKIDAGSYKLFIEEKDLVYVVEESALSLKSLVEQKGINLIFDTDIEECVMKFDENAIERCVVNIVNNASKFTDEGGEIFVNITDLNDNIRIDISDTGSGIPKENLNSIFDRFSQVINSKREATSGGSGLGLTITKRLVELHKGEIFVESEINKGSTFTIILPKVVEE